MGTWSPDCPFRPIDGVAGQNLTVGAASVQSAALSSATYAVRLSTTGDCRIRFGQAPVAVGTDLLLKATDPGAVFRSSPGEKIAVIQNAASTGVLSITELTH